MSETIVWITADGTHVPLLDQAKLDTLWGIEGRFMPPTELVSDVVVGVAGTRFRTARRGPRRVRIPIIVLGDDRSDLIQQVRQLASAVSPRKGMGKLRVNGERELWCMYEEGFEGLEEIDGGGLTGQLGELVFKAFDPFWYDVAPDVRVIGIAASVLLSTSSSDSWFPWYLAGEHAYGGFVIDNDGDEEAWPLWSVQGPGSGNLRLSSLTAGLDTLIPDVSLALGEQIHVDTRPGHKTVVGPNGENLWPELTDDSVLWPIEPGPQELEAFLEGAAPESEVRLEWYRRWLVL